ncbi:MAG: putative zinc-type alcohol dehydrogenase-like protein YjmD [Firmicutes bacterium ADurb.Bin182]|nr:MAG: putative zinc-type alcohol dehydrogenase-like protein YjmD [Firmicutes bacterium ADurb.Bin182]
MKSVYLKEPNDIKIKQIDKPVFKEGYALIRIKSFGICGSDIGAFRGVNPIVSYPRIIGHELAGIVEEIGENQAGLKKGDRVVIDPYLWCGKCYPCSLGRTNCCETLKCLGVHVDGGMTEYLLHPAHMLVPLSESIPWELAPLSEPLTISIHGIHRANVKAGQRIAINGAGTIGLLAALASMAYGAEPILVDPVEERLNNARKLGVKHTVCIPAQNAAERIREITNGRMAEVVMEASGSNQAIRSCLDMVSYAGKIVLTGWPKNETTLPTNIITTKELDVLGGRNSKNEFGEALELIDSGKVNVRAVLSKLINIDDVPDAVRELSEYPERYLKIVALTD